MATLARTVNRSATAKEALIAELMGDLADLIDRAERLTPAINKAREAMLEAAYGLTSGVPPFKAHMVKIAGITQTSSIEQIDRRAREMMVDTLFDVKLSMTQSARALFKDEVAPTLSQLTKDLRDAIDRAHHPWDGWKTHAATAILSGVAAWLVCYFLCR